MRTTVDLPPFLHNRVRRYAAEQGQSLSATVAALTARGLEGLVPGPEIEIDPISGFPVVDLGRDYTTDEAAKVVEAEPY
jgi:hypothetical protein